MKPTDRKVSAGGEFISNLTLPVHGNVSEVVGSCELCFGKFIGRLLQRCLQNHN